MAKVVINGVDDCLNLSSKELGISDWVKVDQNMIDQFAETTHDHQWIHVNQDRAKKESPYGTTIAHGYLTLSLLPCLLNDIIEVRNLKQLVNYSIKDMVYKAAVPVDSNLRLRAVLKSARDLGSICKATIQCSFEVEGCEKPVLEGSIVFLYYF